MQYRAAHDPARQDGILSYFPSLAVRERQNNRTQNGLSNFESSSRFKVVLLQFTK